MPAVNLRERAYEHILEQMTTGRIRPGERLSKRALASEIGISPIPVREALSQLVIQGLAEHRSGSGVFAPQIDRQGIAELYEVRELLECPAARRAAEGIGDEQLERMQDSVDRMREIAAAVAEQPDGEWSVGQVDGWLMADASFHLTILQAARNRLLMKIVAGERMMMRIFGHRWRSRSAELVNRSIAEHEELLAALRRRDGEAAAETLRNIIRHGCRIAMEIYDRQRMDEASGSLSQYEQPPDLRRRVHKMEEDAGGK